MEQIGQGIFYDDTYLGVTLGALVFPYGTILIDAPLRTEDARSWRSSLANQRGGPNRMIVNLDAHPDRTLGVRSMDCTVVAHQKTAEVFRNRPSIFKGLTVETGADWEIYGDAIGARWASPDITFTTSMNLHWGGSNIILQHQPCTSPGAIWVVAPEARVVFIGDCVLANQPPFLAFADLDAWIACLDALLKDYRGYSIISGRSGLISPNHIKAQKKFLKDVIRALDRLAKRDAMPEDTGALVQGLLSKLSVPPESKERFANRLRYGLSQCYARRYKAASDFISTDVEEDDE